MHSLERGYTVFKEKYYIVSDMLHRRIILQRVLESVYGVRGKMNIYAAPVNEEALASRAAGFSEPDVGFAHAYTSVEEREDLKAGVSFAHAYSSLEEREDTTLEAVIDSVKRIKHVKQ
ncbi:hypothetical protein BT96DRAFT_942662 [Gymnopus androsaceus JB14]|uniref:Uncharacterized protein n=1 Tax=Gymnopus androsaceus JB14 TaxID=1447944 RepID=A0A6A4HD22_9AGAR|nr:hypothetical protein BT96DRAFT_942662 [Gymnopus androsaceus JB14]